MFDAAKLSKSYPANAAHFSLISRDCVPSNCCITQLQYPTNVGYSCLSHDYTYQQSISHVLVSNPII